MRLKNMFKLNSYVFILSAILCQASSLSLEALVVLDLAVRISLSSSYNFKIISCSLGLKKWALSFFLIIWKSIWKTHKYKCFFFFMYESKVTKLYLNINVVFCVWWALLTSVCVHDAIRFSELDWSPLYVDAWTRSYPRCFNARFINQIVTCRTWAGTKPGLIDAVDQSDPRQVISSCVRGGNRWRRPGLQNPDISELC